MPITPETLPPDLATLLGQRASEAPDRQFAHFIDSGADITVGELDRAANRFANTLNHAGVNAGDRVVIMLPNVPEMLIAQFGAYKAGVVAVCVNVEFRGAPLARMINLAGSPVMVVHEDFVEAVVDVRSELPALETVIVVGDIGAATRFPDARAFDGALSDVDTFTPPDLRPSAPAGILFTSGTTGVSKGCLLSHRYLLACGLANARFIRLRSHSVAYTPWPLYHMAAGLMEVPAALLTRSRVVFRRRFSARRFWPDIREHGATAVCLLGTVARILETRPPDPSDIDNPLEVAWGGPLPKAKAAFEKRFGLRLIAGYASTDVGLVSRERIDSPERDPDDCHGPVQDNYEVRIVDEEGDPVPSGEVGEILVRSRLAHIMSAGYFGMPEATVEAWDDLWFHTGDLGRVDAQGRLYYLGRKRETIRRSGENISVFEVEESLGMHPAVADVAVIGVPSEMGEQEVAAFIAPRNGEDLDETALRAYCEKHITRFMIPKHFRFVTEIPRTPTGKSAIAALQTMFNDGYR